MKSNFSQPKIYTGGVDVSRWSKLEVILGKIPDKYHFKERIHLVILKIH